jgi:hypothetical protein
VLLLRARVGSYGVIRNNGSAGVANGEGGGKVLVVRAEKAVPFRFLFVL